MKKITNGEAKQIEAEQLHSEPVLKAKIMSWKIRAHPHPMFFIDVIFGFFSLIFSAIYLYGDGHENENRGESFMVIGFTGLCMLLFFWFVIARKKTVFMFLITQCSIHVESWEDYWKYTPYLFKGIAIIFFIVVLTMIALDPSFIWMLAGPGAMAIAASSKLMSFENPIERYSTEWSRYDLVFIDRKRKMVVPSYHKNPLLGFEIHVENARSTKL